MIVGCLGPETNSEVAARKILRKKDELVFFDTVRDVLLALDRRSAQRIVVPVMNSVTGDISYGELVKRMGLIKRLEVTVPIKHCLAISERSGRGIGFVLSHREVLKQCADYLDERYPLVYRGEMASTGEAARFIGNVRSNNGVAIANLSTCLHYKLRVIDRDIVKNNYSTFWVVER